MKSDCGRSGGTLLGFYEKKYIRGYVRIRLESPAPGYGFSVLCVHNRIPLRNLTHGSFPSMKWNSLPEISCVLAGFAGKQMPGSISYLKTVCLSFYFMHEKERHFFLGIFLGLFFVICMFPSYLGYSDHWKPLLYHTCSPGYIIRMGYPLWYGKEKCRLPEADAENPAGLSRCCLGICKA